MGASNSPRLAFAKTFRSVDRDAERRERERRDRQERAQCRLRAGGRCEARIVRPDGVVIQCRKFPVHNHHRYGGAERNRSDRSIGASNRAQLCAQHHFDIEEGRLEIVEGWDEANWAGTVRWRYV